MKILVIEDTPRHQESARKTLSDHDVTIAESFDEAMRHLGNSYVTKENGEDIIERGEFGNYDAVLIDLFLPMSKWQIGGEQYNPEELVSYGMQIALMAAMKNVPLILVATDKNHHGGPVAASLDYLKNPKESSIGTRMRIGPHLFRIEDSVCHIRHARKISLESGEKAKDWGEMLDELIEATEEE